MYGTLTELLGAANGIHSGNPLLQSSPQPVTHEQKTTPKYTSSSDGLITANRNRKIRPKTACDSNANGVPPMNHY